MKIFSTKQIKKWEEFTIDNQSISDLQLMERAANSCVDWLIKKFDNTPSFSIFCGKGNNGGDGFAIARLLYLKGFDVIIFANENQDYSENSSVNFDRCKEISGIKILNYEDVDD